MKIVISGEAGSGKSSSADAVAKKLILKRFSTGDLQRKVAESRGISINQLGELGASDPKIDLEMDAMSKELGEREDNFVIDSWLAAFFIPDALKVYLTADIDVRVGRRLKQKRTTESFTDSKDAKNALLEREKVNRERWIKLYGFDYSDESNYDLIIDTTLLSVDETSDVIVEATKNLY
jgi:cytidylate kinase